MPRPDPSEKFSAQGASFRRSVCTRNTSRDGALGSSELGSQDWMMRWGPSQSRSRWSWGCFCREGGKRGCRTVPDCLEKGSGWTRLGLGVLGREWGPGLASKAETGSPSLSR